MRLKKLYRESVARKNDLDNFRGVQSALSWAHVESHREYLLDEMKSIVERHEMSGQGLEDKLVELFEGSVKNLAIELRCEESMAMYRARVELGD